MKGNAKSLTNILELSQKTTSTVMDPPIYFSKNACVAANMKIPLSEWSTIYLTSTKPK